MKQVKSKEITASMWSNTTGIANQIESVLDKVYSAGAGANGTAIIVRDSDGQLYEIDIKPAKFGTHKDELQQYLMKSDRKEDKDLLREMFQQEASGTKQIEDWPE